MSDEERAEYIKGLEEFIKHATPIMEVLVRDGIQLDYEANPDATVEAKS